MEALFRTPVPMVPGSSACSNTGARTTSPGHYSVGGSQVHYGAWKPCPDLSHRKSATTAGTPNEHPSRVPPATPYRPQPRFPITSRSGPPSCLGVVDVRTVWTALSPASCLPIWDGGRRRRVVMVGPLRLGPDAGAGWVPSCSERPPRRCCALSDRGPPKRWRRQGAAAARGRQRAGRRRRAALIQVKKL